MFRNTTEYCQIDVTYIQTKNEMVQCYYKTYNLYLTFQLHVHGKGDYLEFEQAQYVMGVAENRPAGTVVGSARCKTLFNKDFLENLFVLLCSIIFP